MAMTTLEAHLASLEAQVGGTEKAISALVMNLKHLKKAVGYGHLADMDKSLPLVAQRAEEVRNVALSLSDAWSLDVTKHLEQGYLAELLQEADAQGVNLIERDGRLFCFPLPIMIDAREAAVRIGKKKEQRLRPKILVALLATMQKARLRFNARKFLDAIYQVYRRVQGENWHKIESGPGPAMPLADVHEVLTLLPGSSYSVEEFGRDLLLLARQPDLRTREGCSFQFPGSTLSKERLRRLNVFDEHGNEVVFVAVRFVKGDMK
jgi:hypothetical protein